VKRDSADEFARLDFLFHASIVKAAQNRFFQEYRLLLYAVLVIVILIVRPDGFVPRRVRTLRTDDRV
jgi:DNA-binding FadR family transcriptional regulator